MKKNEIYEAEITGMTSEGAGVCRVDGMAVFVPMTAAGDRLRVRIVKVLKSYAFGIVEELLEPGAGRCEPDCPVFRQCGGCTYRHVDYPTELGYKAQQVQDAFERIGDLHPEFLPILGADSRERYRNKAQYPVAEQDGKLVCGFYAKHSHRVIPYTRCALQPERFAELIEWLLPRLQAAGVTAYSEESHTGELRHIYIRQGQPKAARGASQCADGAKFGKDPIRPLSAARSLGESCKRRHAAGELSLCFVVRVSIAAKIKILLPELQAAFPEAVSITENLNPGRTNVILGKLLNVLAGKGTITDTMCGNRVELSPLSFYQVNTAQAERLYGIGREFAALHGDELLLDLYCGAGTIGLSMAREVKSLIGVEVIPEAVENARENARRNGIDNAQFYCGDAGQIAAKLRQEGTAPDVIILDPPRKGCDTVTIESCAAMQPSRIVMISCNPATAARDCKAFAALGYRTEKVRAVDLFGGTAHVECVLLMSRIE